LITHGRHLPVTLAALNTQNNFFSGNQLQKKWKFTVSKKNLYNLLNQANIFKKITNYLTKQFFI